MINEEEKKAINSLKNEYKKLEEEGNILFPLFKQQAKTILNLITKLQKENNLLNNYVKENEIYKKNLFNYAEKKDKQIDLMSQKINQAYFDENDFYSWFEEEFGIIPKGHYEEKIKQYFETKAKEKGE